MSVLKRVLYLILISTAVRVIVASVLELSNDEVYYYLYALDIQPNYFDHPPGVGILIRLFTGNLIFTHEFFIRSGAIVCAALGTFFSYRLGVLMKNENTGWLAAMLYNTSVYTSVIAGTFIIPDSPQVVFWLGALWAMYAIMLKADQQQTILLSQWLSFGLLAGLCMLCKVHGIFLWFGLGLYILFFKIKLLTRYGLYLSALITCITISPVLWWNIQNDFITYRFHSERVAVQESIVHLDYFFQAIGGQLLYTNPVNAALIIIALLKLRSVKFLDRTASRFLLLNGLPIIIVVTGMSLFNPMLPHWSGPGFMILSFLAAAYLDEKIPKPSSFALPLVMKAGVSLITVALLAATLLIKFYPGTFGSQEKLRYGDGDFTLDMYGWKQFADNFKPWMGEQKMNKLLPQDIKIVSHKWFPAAHLDYYVASPLHIPLIGVGDVNDLHQYYWLNKNRPSLHRGERALCIVPTNYQVNMDETYRLYFTSVELLHRFENMRGGSLARYFDVYLLTDYQMNDEMYQR